jgi:hypothetical protein
VASCTYHCRSCESHFTSLAAFDAHRENYECAWPDNAPLTEISGGVCKIGDPSAPQVNVTLYEHSDAARLREYRKGTGGRQTAETERKSGAMAR